MTIIIYQFFSKINDKHNFYIEAKPTTPVLPQHLSIPFNSWKEVTCSVRSRPPATSFMWTKLMKVIFCCST